MYLDQKNPTDNLRVPVFPVDEANMEDEVLVHNQEQYEDGAPAEFRGGGWNSKVGDARGGDAFIDSLYLPDRCDDEALVFVVNRAG
ncbi:hypothetical protein GCM10028800_13290 [Nesterenkonia populi]